MARATKIEKMIGIIQYWQTTLDMMQYHVHAVNEYENILEKEELSDYMQGKMDQLKELEEIFSSEENMDRELEMLADQGRLFLKMTEGFQE